MSLDYPRNWHHGRTILLLTWLFAAVSYGALFVGATYEGEGFAPRHLLLALLSTQALLLAAALLSHAKGVTALTVLIEEKTKTFYWLALGLNLAALLVMSFSMRPWNDELNNLHQASYLADNGLQQWWANYSTVNAWMGPQHPPLLALLYGLFYLVAGPHLLAGRLFNILFSMLSLMVGARMIRRCTNETTAVLALLCWPIFPLWLFNGTAALLESPFLLIFLLATDAFIQFRHKSSARQAAIVGLWMTLGLMCRYNIALLFPCMFFLLAGPAHRWLLTQRRTWWIVGVPLLALAPLAGYAAVSNLLVIQAGPLASTLLLLRKGGLDYLIAFLLPLWPLHVGAQTLPILFLGFWALTRKTPDDLLLLTIGGAYFLVVLLLHPNPRYLVPAVPFIAAGIARLLQMLDTENMSAWAVWLGAVGSSIILTALVTAGANLGDFYPFY